MAIAATVVWLSWSHADVTPASEPAGVGVHGGSRTRERLVPAGYAVAALAAALLLHHTSQQPHASAAAEGESSSAAAASIHLTPAQTVKHFPKGDIGRLERVVTTTRSAVAAGDHKASTASAKTLETTWDADQPRLQPKDGRARTLLDGQIDGVLQSVRAPSPRHGGRDSRAGHPADLAPGLSHHGAGPGLPGPAPRLA
ncbi:hypothetical protein LP422_23110 [Janibacter limosus]|uniref:hypothetical protein n=1 Tax=Janibacter limosus TaxID=53458 RepID=UPI0035D7858D|nr:hypothetical protein LP422_23110 [Janibacter limosus]